VPEHADNARVDAQNLQPEPRAEAFDAWDNLHGPSRPDVHWSTDNVGEAAPGVLCPLSASIWGEFGERTSRAAFVAIGAFPRREARVPEALEDRVVRVFYGRLALQVELMTLLGDRLPGTSGREIAASLLGTVPDDIAYRPTKRRYPAVALKLPATFATMPRRIARMSADMERWWQVSVQELATATPDRSRQLLSVALDRFEQALTLQTVSVLASAQLLHEALSGLVESAGVGDLGVLSGSGGAEMAVIGDIWKVSRGELPLSTVLGRHGFHGPLEGEVSSIVWREDPAPLVRLISEYAARDDSHDPARRDAAIRAQLPEMQRAVIAALPRSRRAGGRVVLDLAARRIPLRGVAKRSFLQALDVIRASARRIGAELCDTGTLANPEDAFFLTVGELGDAAPRGAAEVVARRRARREQYRRLEIPSAWKGTPVPLTPDVSADRARVITGVGVSNGVIEGVARVVTDPAFGEVQPDEILVAQTTDPSWSSIMFISAALVVDIGGPVSHAAVVARELGIPCVVNTRTGTRQIHTGDRVRVDGQAGTVEILGSPSRISQASTLEEAV
jgi:pyruvate,water dikinase